MNNVLEGLVGKICRVFLDDNIVFGKDFNDHLHNLELALSRLAAANLEVNTKKCVFFKHEVLYLGHLISRDGIKCSSQNNSILNWPIRQPKTEIKSC